MIYESRLQSGCTAIGDTGGEQITLAGTWENLNKVILIITVDPKEMNVVWLFATISRHNLPYSMRKWVYKRIFTK